MDKTPNDTLNNRWDAPPGRTGGVVILLGHPRGMNSLSGALAGAYAEAAAAAGRPVEIIDLSALAFDPELHVQSPRQQPLEPDLEDARKRITAATHLCLVFPVWWGSLPGRLKGFLDRVLLPGWAFAEIAGGTGYQPLLSGKTADIVMTMDTPAFVWRWVYRAPATHQMVRATLGFCGVETTRVLRFGPVKSSSPADRAGWIARTRALAARLNGPARSPAQRLRAAFAPWLQALRLQFYPMTFLAYWLGALMAAGSPALSLPAFWMGYLTLFLLEAATVFTNDVHDYESDRRNLYWGPFTGGSRVIVDGILSPRALARAAWAAALLALALAAASASVSVNPAGSAAVLAVLAPLALGYTLPPLKLSHRGLGEITVGITHSFGVLLFGYTMQGGALLAPQPWLIAFPLMLSVLPAIILSGLPDAAADAASGKRTLVGIFGAGGAMAWAAAAALTAMAMALMLRVSDHGALMAGIELIAPVHAVVLASAIAQEWRRGPFPRRIDGLMVLALVYIIWFALIPLANLLR